jgi:hypothetical protein
MSVRPDPPPAAGCRGGDPAGLLALLAAFVVVFQLPGPATCLKLAWRFTAVPVATSESEGAGAETPTAELEAVADVRDAALVDPDRPAVVRVVTPLVRPNLALEAGTTRAPPTA